MPVAHGFEHLPLIRTFKGPAKLNGGGKTAPQTIANKKARQAHSAALEVAADAFIANWQTRKAQRQAAGQALPDIPAGIPLLLQVDPGFDLDALREKFNFEIVSEQEEGYVIVASEDIQLAPFRAMVEGFAVRCTGLPRLRAFTNCLRIPIKLTASGGSSPIISWRFGVASWESSPT